MARFRDSLCAVRLVSLCRMWRLRKVPLRIRWRAIAFWSLVYYLPGGWRYAATPRGSPPWRTGSNDGVLVCLGFDGRKRARILGIHWQKC